MIELVVIQEGRGERVLHEGDLPLIIGASARSTIRSSALPPTEELAYIGFANGSPFVQPCSADAAVSRNQEALRQSAWLADGDLIQVGNVRIVCSLSSDRVRLQVEEIDRSSIADEGDTLPPVIVEPPTDEEPLKAVSFSPLEGSAPRPRSRFRRLIIVLFSIAVLTAPLVWFTFAARGVLLEVEPVPTSLALHDGSMAVRLADRYLALPGRYTVVAEHPGFHPLHETIEITRAPNQRFAFTLRKLPGLLSVSSRPVDDAEVMVDGVLRGATPVSAIELEPGSHEILVRKERYQDWRTELMVEGGGVAQTLDAELMPGWGVVHLESVPTGAGVRVDDTVVGETPLHLELMAGSYRVQVEKPLWKPWSTSLTVVASQEHTLAEIRLVKADGSLLVNSRPSGGTVSVDGNYRGRTPIEVTLPADRTVKVTVSKSGYESATRKTSVVAGQSKRLEMRLEPRLGEINVVVEPRDAELIVDGKPMGSGSQVLRLTAAAHDLQVRRQGYETAQHELTPRVGFRQKLVVELRPEAVARAEALPPILQTSQGQRLHRVSPGRFTMGASRREQGRRANESLRQVELTRTFYIGEREVTNGEFRRFDAGHTSGTAGRFSLDGDDQPVVRVSWDQAASYCNWLSAKEGVPLAYQKKNGSMSPVQPPTIGYRLPTEAEWEWVARTAGRNAPVKYPWGQSWPPRQGAGNYADSKALGLTPNNLSSYDDGYPVSAPVGRFAANPLGVLDLGGNAAEWSHDYYTIYSSGGTALAKDPMGPVNGKHHVIRGSSWRDSSMSALRLSYRDYGQKPRLDVGFRIARYAQ